jgi:hypothetical protein
VNLRKSANSLVARLVVMGLLMAIVGTAASYFQLSRFLRQDLTQSVASSRRPWPTTWPATSTTTWASGCRSWSAWPPPCRRNCWHSPEALHAWLRRARTLSPVFPLGLTVTT